MVGGFGLFSYLFVSLSHQGVEAGLEEERLQRERQETQWVSEAEARAQVLRVKAELKAQERQAVQLESSCRAVDRSIGQSSKKLQVRHMHAFQYLFFITLRFVCFFYKKVMQGDVVIRESIHQ